MQTKVLYRIYTENVNLSGIENAVGFFFDGATVYLGRGFYKEIVENCVIIEIVGGLDLYNQVVRFADALKLANKQSSVLITRQPVEVEFR